MRNNKNDITSSFKNIILFLNNLTSHFTGKEKIITFISIIIMLSFTNITFTSALSYQSSVGVGFTFNPTLSVNISSSDLVIPNLAPGTTNDSNTINVSVATNAAYGHTLSAIMNGNNSNLTHTNGTNVFSSIDTDANLSSLTTDNTWGYSYKLSNNTNWNNYSGLSTETSKTLVDSNDQTAIPIDFKIAAKAASTQASGTYTGTINFTAVTKPKPINLADAYASAGKTMHNGYYVMQDMTSAICNSVEDIGTQLQVIDIRDDEVYWISKLADNHCWMTQNLDLDLDSDKNYTHWNTDLGWTILDEDITWKPTHSTINFTGLSTNNWISSDTEPYSANPGDIYYYTSNSNTNDIQYNSLQNCKEAGHNDCAHYHVGNYYNWSAAVADNDTSQLVSSNAPNSVCPSGWKLPNTTINEFEALINAYNIVSSNSLDLRSNPLYFTRSGYFYGYLEEQSSAGGYWSSTIVNSTNARELYFYSNHLFSNYNSSKPFGVSVRCLAR